MDVGPFRGQRPTETRVPPRQGTATQAPPEPQPIEKEPPKPMNRPAQTRFSTEKEKPKRLIIVLIAAAVVAVGIIGWFAVSNLGGGMINGGKYQAVFFTNGQVYFGKLQQKGDGYYRLTEVFYLQSPSQQGTDDAENPQQASSDQNSVQLIKLGSEIHGPEDEMIINRDQVLFYENLKSDGSVSQKIEEYKKQ